MAGQIYESNDTCSTPDRLYLNEQKRRSCREVSLEQWDILPIFSMGNDVADINNDLLPDIFTLDMLPEDNRRQNYWWLRQLLQVWFERTIGFHHQYMQYVTPQQRKWLFGRNGTSIRNFGEYRLELVGAFADYGNDGWKDICNQWVFAWLYQFGFFENIWMISLSKSKAVFSVKMY